MTEPIETLRDQHSTRRELTELDLTGRDGLTLSELDTIDAECEEFQSRMAERIGNGEDLQTYSHMMACERCQGLIRELEYMAQAIRDSLLTPIEVDPGDDVWINIVSKLGLDDSGFNEMTLEHGEA